MKITFIMPGVGQKEDETYVNSWKMEPLTLAVLASLTPDGIKVNFFDDRIEPIPYDEPTDLVAINVETYSARRAYHIASQFRKRGIPVILGGYHPTLIPDEVAQFADSVLIGEAEEVWLQAINDVKNNRLQKFYKSGQPPLLNGIKPKRSIYKDKEYLPLTLVESARGCKFSCSFCSVSSFFNQIHNCRPVSEVIKEIEALGKKNIFLIDDNIACDFKRAKELFRALIPLKISWVGQGSINMANDVEMLKVMRKSGCRLLLIGFESLKRGNLLQMKKDWNIKNNYEEAIEKIRDSGIAIYATFIFGYDYDDLDSFDITLEFALKQKFFLAAFNHLIPFPGTHLYNELKEEKRLLYQKWWLDPNYRFGDVAFKPNLLTPKQLSDSCMKARFKFYRFSSIFKRATDLKSNCNSLEAFIKFFLLNIFSQKEVKRRQGIPIGEGLDSGDKK